jgi:hypothetical protein
MPTLWCFEEYVKLKLEDQDRRLKALEEPHAPQIVEQESPRQPIDYNDSALVWEFYFWLSKFSDGTFHPESKLTQVSLALKETLLEQAKKLRISL